MRAASLIEQLYKGWTFVNVVRNAWLHSGSCFTYGRTMSMFETGVTSGTLTRAEVVARHFAKESKMEKIWVLTHCGGDEPTVSLFRTRAGAEVFANAADPDASIVGPEEEEIVEDELYYLLEHLTVHED